MKQRLATQLDQILFALQMGDELTPMGALNRFGCFRLAAQVFKLKEAGHNIQTTMKTVNGHSFASYKLIKPEGPCQE